MPILNKNTVSVPSIDGAGSQIYTRVIKVDRNSGLFSASVPDHLKAAAALVHSEQVFPRPGRDGEQWRKLDYHTSGKYAGEITAETRDSVVDRWSNLMYRCSEFLTQQTKVKVIVLQTEMNVTVRDENGRVLLRRRDNHFGETNPLVGVSYQVCYQTGDHLIDEENHTVRRPERSTVIPYTPERESFLRNIVDTFKRAAVQLHEFSELVKTDPLKIEDVMRQGFLLTEKPSQ